jgi:hypothetical protein
MSRARHAFKDGGDVQDDATPSKINKGREDVKEKEMEEGHKRGGSVKRAAGGSVVARKRGGGVEMGEGMMPKSRMDRPGRKRGGGVGANITPLSTAARTTDAKEHSTEMPDED